MKERPILFSAEMVRAILEGRKTQTRRVMKPQPVKMEFDDGIAFCAFPAWFRTGGVFKSLGDALKDKCPYGQVGDRLWVKESFAVQPNLVLPLKTPQSIHYLSDSPLGQIEDYLCKPSIHMPRWASRIELEITGVRVERLQEISEEDARAEGAPLGRWYHPPNKPEGDSVNLGAVGTVFNATWEHPSYRNGFAALWYSINGRRGYAYEMNPWVWVIEFKAVQP